MDVSAFNLATVGTMAEEGTMAVPGAAAVGGDVFAKLMSGLGIAPPPTATEVALVDDAALADAPPGDVAAVEAASAAVGPAVSLVRDPAMLTAPQAAKGERAKPSIGATSDTREPAPEAEAPTPASLGLPPLLAALFAPTLAKAAPAAPVAARGSPKADGAAVTQMIGGTGPAALAGPSTAAAQGQLPTEAPLKPIGSTATAALRQETGLVVSNGAMHAAPAGGAPLPAGAEFSQPASADLVMPSSRGPEATRSTLGTSPLPTAEAARAVVGATAPSPTLRETKALAGEALEATEDVASPAQPALPMLQALPRRTPPSTAPKIEPMERATPAEQPAPGLDIAAPASPRTLVNAATLPMPLEVGAASAPPVPAAVETAAPAEQLIERQLDMAHEGEWLDQLTRDIVRTASAEGSLRFRLNPENLGSLQVEVTPGQAGASVRFTADTEQARSVIADARPQLVAEARAQGLRISETHVDLNGQGQSQSHGGNGGRDARDLPGREYLTSWKPESAEEKATPSRRSTAERYA